MFTRMKPTKVAMATLFTISAILLPRAIAADTPGKVEFNTGYPLGVPPGPGTIPGKIKIFGTQTLPVGNPTWAHWATQATIKDRAPNGATTTIGLQELNGGVGTVGGGPPPICTEAVQNMVAGNYDVQLSSSWIRWVNGVQEQQVKTSATTTVTV